MHLLVLSMQHCLWGEGFVCLSVSVLPVTENFELVYFIYVRDCIFAAHMRLSVLQKRLPFLIIHVV